MLATETEAVENYRDIAGYEGFYQVSDLGNVRSVARKVPGNALFPVKVMRGRKLSFKTTASYWRVMLCREGKTKRFLVHRLVAIAFILNPEGLAQVNHKNGQKHDNRAQNLEWVSAQQNIAHSVQTGLSLRGEQIGTAKLTAELVLEIRHLAPAHTLAALSEKFGISQGQISRIVLRRSWTHL